MKIDKSNFPRFLLIYSEILVQVLFFHHPLESVFLVGVLFANAFMQTELNIIPLHSRIELDLGTTLERAHSSKFLCFFSAVPPLNPNVSLILFKQYIQGCQLERTNKSEGNNIKYSKGAEE